MTSDGEKDIIVLLICLIGGTIVAGFSLAGPIVGLLVIIAWLLLAAVLLLGVTL